MEYNTGAYGLTKMVSLYQKNQIIRRDLNDWQIYDREYLYVYMPSMGYDIKIGYSTGNSSHYFFNNPALHEDFRIIRDIILPYPGYALPMPISYRNFIWSVNSYKRGVTTRIVKDKIRIRARSTGKPFLTFHGGTATERYLALILMAAALDTKILKQLTNVEKRNYFVKAPRYILRDVYICAGGFTISLFDYMSDIRREFSSYLTFFIAKLLMSSLYNDTDWVLARFQRIRDYVADIKGTDLWL